MRLWFQALARLGEIAAILAGSARVANQPELVAQVARAFRGEDYDPPLCLSWVSSAQRLIQRVCEFLAFHFFQIVQKSPNRSESVIWCASGTYVFRGCASISGDDDGTTGSALGGSVANRRGIKTLQNAPM
jgi:hypothetical protein